MKLQIQRETLLKPLQLVIGVVERKQTQPILANVLLRTKDNKLSVTGTDTEVELIGQISLAQPSTEDHALTIPGRKLMDICRALPENAPVELYREQEKIVLCSGRSRFTLSTLPVEDFPHVEPQDTHLSFTMAKQLLRGLLQRTAFAMAQQDVRYYLNGLLLEVHPEKLHAVATDGHRLAFNSALVHTNTDRRLQIILPRKGVLELMRLLEDNNESITVTISNHYLRIMTDHFAFTSKLVEGRFPNYERVIPKNGDKWITLDRDVLKAALQRTAILCNDKFKGVRFELRSNSLRILANNPEQEAAEEEISINYSQEDLDIGFNVHYLLDILAIAKPGDIKLTFIDANSSVLVEELPTSSESVFVIMPMRL
ncbi:MAG: DNA polymerase III subunit beta [Gammaproteobacteria bacterium RIFCSPHIGHO2_12_FULL_41_15]|nr:MAG: DNA polymerase III subunit beta [Gammaproteobacteria bacterium RIFCSPHIGHO2_12_FULL_41_15]